MSTVQPFDLALLCVAALLSLWGLRYLGVILFTSMKLALLGGVVLMLVHSTAVGKNAIGALVESSSVLGPLVRNGTELYLSARTIGANLIGPERLSAAMTTPPAETAATGPRKTTATAL